MSGHSPRDSESSRTTVHYEMPGLISRVFVDVDDTVALRDEIVRRCCRFA